MIHLRTVSHKSYDLCFDVFLIEATIMTFVAHCTLFRGFSVYNFIFEMLKVILGKFRSGEMRLG